MSNSNKNTLTITVARGPYTWEAPAVYVFDVETRRHGHFANNSSHRNVEVAKAEALRQVRLFGNARPDVRIRRRLAVA